MKKILLKNIMNKNSFKTELKESAVGDLYINIGETIEKLELLQIKLYKLISIVDNKKAYAILNNIKQQINKLKNEFGDSYYFKP